MEDVLKTAQIPMGATYVCVCLVTYYVLTTERAMVNSPFLRNVPDYIIYCINFKYIMHRDNAGHFPISTVLILHCI